MNKQIFIDTIKEFYAELKNKLEPLKEYWLRLSQRDQQILIVVFVISLIVVAYMLFNNAINYRAMLIKELENSRLQYEEAIGISKDYRKFSKITANDFITPNSDVIKQEVQQELSARDTEVTITDGILNVKSSEVKFDNVVTFLDNLRKGFGLFPVKMKITRLSIAGYVAISIDYIFKGEPIK